MTEELFLLIESEIFALKAEGNEIKRKKIPANITSKKCRNDKGLVSRLIVSIECKFQGRWAAVMVEGN